MPPLTASPNLVEVLPHVKISAICSVRMPDSQSRLTEVDREAALDPIRRAVFTKLQALVSRRLKDDQLTNWRIAFDFSGKGSASRRADVINDINHDAAPHMSANMTQDARDFLDRLYAILRDAIETSGGKIRAV
jgi:hypothetical protein